MVVGVDGGGCGWWWVWMVVGVDGGGMAGSYDVGTGPGHDVGCCKLRGRQRNCLHASWKGIEASKQQEIGQLQDLSLTSVQPGRQGSW
jgi:hypothetical protein